MRSLALAPELQSFPPPYSSKDVFNIVPKAIVAFVKGFYSFLVALLGYVMGMSAFLNSSAKFGAINTALKYKSLVLRMRYVAL